MSFTDKDLTFGELSCQIEYPGDFYGKKMFKDLALTALAQFVLLSFWDYKEKRQLGVTRAEWSVTSEWSPDGRYFLTATTAPRLQVDNGVKIFHPNGTLYFKKMFDKLYQVDWKPESVEKFGAIEDLVKAVSSVEIDEAKAPGKGSKASQAIPKAAQAVPKATPANPPAAKPAAYRPPHAKVAAAVQAELFGGSSSGELSKNALKNKKKREKQREKKQAEAASATGGS
ncbi:hypothetical protein HAX54_009027 [Datura stramonium]|uniref:Translation initiation factor beta propellor-like domain-containing protein n=1 Tax=Datura stramonium TaxID=4076 RepID=A0ABS8TEC8_DATST|nr:hypothetical protein [Datura stramonium]